MRNRLLGLVVVLVACSLLVTGCGAKSGTVTHYTSMPEASVTKLIEAFKKVQPEVTINLYRAGTGTVLAKLDAEIMANQIVADTVSVAEPDASLILKDRGVLLKFTPKGADKLAAPYKDKDGYFYSIGLSNMVIIYNTQLMSEPPTGFADLIKPEYKNRITLGHPANSGAMAHLIGTMLNNGFEWSYFEALRDNGAIIVKGPSDAAQKVATGEALLGITQDATARQLMEKGSPVAYILASEGSVLKNTNIQIMKATKNKSAAIAWVEFLLSAEAQQLMADQKIATPVLPGIKLPAGYEDPAKIKAMRLDDDWVAKNSSTIKDRFSEIFGGT